MRIKKILCVLAAMLAITSGVYGAEIVDLSAGVSFNIGNPFLRGSGVGALDKSALEDDLSSLYIGGRLDVLVNFTENFGLETGLGFSRSYTKADYTFDSTEITYEENYYSANGRSWETLYEKIAITDSKGSQLIQRTQLYIPIMFRAQYGYGVGNLYMVTYGSVGLKIGFSLADFYNLSESYTESITYTSTLDSDTLALSGLNSEDIIRISDVVPCAGFTFDIALAIGQEFKLGENHYVGVRFGLDVNILEPHSGYVQYSGDYNRYSLDETYGAGAGDIYMDNFNFSLTYRYSFAHSLWG